MKNLMKFTQVMAFILFAPLSKSSVQEFDCDKSLKVQEKNVLDIITLYGKKTDLENIVMGSYNWPEITEGRPCYHNIVVKYEVPNEELSSDYLTVWDTIIRYFNLNEIGNPLKPPVFMHARQPLIGKPEEPINKTTRPYPPPYQCEQRFELEERKVRWYTETNKPSTWVASMVIPRREYPFCEYHIFLMYQEDSNDPNSEIGFYHVPRDETWYWHVGGMPYGRDFKFKGRKIPKSEIPSPH